MNGLNPRERRLLALGILVALVAGVWLLVVAPVLQGFAARAEARTEARDELVRDARFVAGFGAAKGEVARLRQGAGAWAWLSPSKAQAAEALRERVAQEVAAQSGALQALRVETAPAGRVRLQADLRMPLIPLTNLLRRLQTDRPFTTVDTLSVAEAEGGAATVATPLEVRLELTYAVR